MTSVPLPPDPEPETPLFTLLRRAGRELGLYLADLIKLFREELREEGRLVRSVLMSMVASAMLLLFSFGLLTVALVGAVAYGLNSWRWALLIVGVAYGLIGAALMGPAINARRAGIARLERVLRRVRLDVETVKRRMAA